MYFSVVTALVLSLSTATQALPHQVGPNTTEVTTGDVAAIKFPTVNFEARADVHDARCPAGQRVMQKKDHPPLILKDLKQGGWGPKYPGIDKFDRCYEGHEICFSNCAKDLKMCNEDIQNCMRDACVDVAGGKGGFYRLINPQKCIDGIKCEMEAKADNRALTSEAVRMGFAKSTNKYCDCV